MSKQKNKDNIDSFIQNTLQNIRHLIEANVIVGNPIQAGKSTIIPINKATVGYITGGGEITNKRAPQFTIGSTSGFNITPIGFIFVDNGSASFVSTQPCTPNEKLLDAIYKMISKKYDEANQKENSGQACNQSTANKSDQNKNKESEDKNNQSNKTKEQSNET